MSDRRPSLRRNLHAIWTFWFDDLTEGWKERSGLEKTPVLWLAPITFVLATWNTLKALWNFGVFKLFHVTARNVSPVLAPDQAKPFGLDLAEKVAQRLERDAATSRGAVGAMTYTHRDYCGHGLFLEKGVFRVAEVHDGVGWEALLEFGTRAEFVNWLAQQSDHSLSGYTGRGPFEDLLHGDNQKITRLRLEQFVTEENA